MHLILFITSEWPISVLHWSAATALLLYQPSGNCSQSSPRPSKARVPPLQFIQHRHTVHLILHHHPHRGSRFPVTCLRSVRVYYYLVFRTKRLPLFPVRCRTHCVAMHSSAFLCWNHEGRKKRDHSAVRGICPSLSQWWWSFTCFVQLLQMRTLGSTSKVSCSSSSSEDWSTEVKASFFLLEFCKNYTG